MKKVFVGIVLCLCIYFVNNVYGIRNESVHLSTSKDNINPNDEIFFYMSMDELKLDENETLEKVEFNIEYDKNIFLTLEDKNISSYNKYNNLEFKPLTNKIVITNTYIDYDNLFVFMLKAKENIKDATTTIKIKNIKVTTNNLKSYNLSNATISLDVENINQSSVDSNILANTDSSNNGNIRNNSKDKNVNLETASLDALNSVNDKLQSFKNSLSSDNIFSILKAPFSVIGIFIYAFLAVILFRVVVTVIYKYIHTRKQIIKNRKIIKKIGKVLSDMNK